MIDTQVGRNDPCPCGSGKKFKRCCLQSPNYDRNAGAIRYAPPISAGTAARNAPSQMAGAFDRTRTPSPHDEPEAPALEAAPLLPVEVGLHYTYPEPFGNAEVSYIFAGGKFFLRQDQAPVCVDDLKIGDRIILTDDNIATITEVEHYYEPPDPPTVHEDGQLFSRVIGTVKHMAPAVLDVEWAGYTASNTPGHRYYSVTRKDYVPAYDLRVGELLRTDDNLVTPVLSVSAPRWGLIDVYNVEVEHYHNYFVGSGKGNAVLVHNGIPGGPGCIGTPKELNSMDDVSTLMRANLPKGMTPKAFGELMQWGRGSASARARMATLTADELRAAGVTAEMANNWAAAYQAVVRLTPNNPSAAGRVDLMQLAARLLKGG